MSALPQTSSLPSSRTPTLTALALLAAIGAIVGAFAAHTGASAWQWLHWVCKPLATMAILLMAWRSVRPVSMRYRRYIVVGIAFCLLGDVLLMWPGNLFVPGLLGFLIGHAFFIAAFSSDVRFAVRWWPWALCLLFGAVMAVVLWPSLTPALRVPVLVYVLVLSTMAGQALGRAFWLRGRQDARAASAQLAALGAVLFMASDSLLAWDRFRAPLPAAALYILATYYAALWLIARSVERGTGIATDD